MTDKAYFLPLRSVNSATFTGAYQVFDSAITKSAVIFKITNNSNVDVTISLDGTTDHEFVPAGSFVLYDLRTNHADSFNFEIRAQTQFYIKGSAGAGSVYLSIIHEVQRY